MVQGSPQFTAEAVARCRTPRRGRGQARPRTPVLRAPERSLRPHTRGGRRHATVWRASARAAGHPQVWHDERRRSPRANGRARQDAGPRAGARHAGPARRIPDRPGAGGARSAASAAWRSSQRCWLLQPDWRLNSPLVPAPARAQPRLQRAAAGGGCIAGRGCVLAVRTDGEGAVRSGQCDARAGGDRARQGWPRAFLAQPPRRCSSSRGMISTKLQGRWRLSSCHRRMSFQASLQAPGEPGRQKM